MRFAWSKIIDGQASRRLRYARLGISALLTFAAISLVTGPILIALKLHTNGLEVGPQTGTPPAAIPRRHAARWRSAALAFPAAPAPIVLAYHDIRPTRSLSLGSRRSALNSGVYNVTPEHFDEQLTALQVARFRSLTEAQYIAYLHGGTVPLRSMLITFDGATQGLWTYADRILAAHHMHGVSFLNPRSIETHWTRYLSWVEIERMQATDRWDFGTALSRKTLASASVSAVNGPVAAALRESTRAFARHRLPVPRLLTLPMPVRGAVPRPLRPAVAVQVVRAPFVAAFANGENLAPPTSRRATTGKLLGRIEVARRADPGTLLGAIASQTAIPISGVNLLLGRHGWATSIHDRSPVAVLGNTLRLTGSGRYENVAYAADSSADWNNYVLNVTVRGVQGSGVENASILVRVGSSRTLAVRVSAHSTALLSTRGTTKTVLRRARLLAAPRHHVRIVVRTHLTRFTIDHVVTFTVRQTPGPRSAGGIGLSGYRQSPGLPWPSFSAITVIPATAAATRTDGLKPISLHARSPLAASRLWLRSPFAHAAVRPAHTPCGSPLPNCATTRSTRPCKPPAGPGTRSAPPPQTSPQAPRSTFTHARARAARLWLSSDRA